MGTSKGIAAVPKYQICVDSIREEDISGRLYCGIIPEGFSFNGIVELTLTIDEIMDKIGFPQSTVEKRSFIKKERPTNGFSRATLAKNQLEMRKFDTSTQKGRMATLILKVKFRQNATWQGAVHWVEKDETYIFKSELELIETINKVCKNYEKPE